MLRRLLWVGAALMLGGLTGCGGGGSSTTPLTGKQLARMRAIDSARLMRATFAIAGLGRSITRQTRAGWSYRSNLVLAALRRTRDVTTGTDVGTGLFYTQTVNADGSGREDLFTDLARTRTAGTILWGAPIWNNNQPNNYPATIHATFKFTAGKFAGNHGTFDLTPQDAAVKLTAIRVALANAKNEQSQSNFHYDNGDVTGTDSAILEDGSTYNEVDAPLPNGDMQCTITYSDNSQEVLDMHADGTVSETVDSLQPARREASGDLTDSGSDTITYSDGSSETVNVDTSDDSTST